MGIIVSKDNNQNSDLTRRITADLRARAEQSKAQDTPDFAEDSEYVKNFQPTGRFSWFWFVLVALSALSLVFIVIL